MAKQSPKCMRNLLGEGHKATEAVKVSYGEGTYLLELCSEHARQLDDQLWGWLRLARDITDENQFAVQLTERLKEAPAHREELPERLREPEPEAVPVSQIELNVLRIRWTLTDHARQRIEQRGPIYGFNLDDVLIAAEKPERAHRDRTGNVGAWVHWRGNVKVVVNRTDKVVITVGGRDEVLSSVAQPA